ncbi:MAG: lipopolysaccharide biosynthesis protein [Acidobacteriota bacterium]
MKPFDAEGRFAPVVPNAGGSLRRLAVRSAGMTIFSGAMGIGIQIVAAATLSRLLTPRDFGLVAMVTTFSYLLMNGPANGFFDLIVQGHELTEELASALFWINFLLAIILSAAFALAGPLMGWFYHERLVAGVAAGISVAVLLTCLPTLHVALLKRAMRFTGVAKNDIVARAVGVLTSIAFAIAGWSYWSLVMGACALALSTAIGAWFMCPWVPRLPRRVPGIRDAIRFTSHITGRYSINYFARNADNLLVGWRFGAHSLGFYKKAYDLFALPANQLVSATSNVAVSALSRVRDDHAQLRRYLLGAIAVMSLIGMGLAGDLTLIGRDLIRVLLGPGWETSGIIFTYFAPGIGMMIVYGVHGWIHVSLGHAERWFRWVIVEWTVILLSFMVGLHWGPQGMAVAWCVSFWILVVPAMSYAGKPIHLRGRSVFFILWRYLVASLAASLLIVYGLKRIPRLDHLGGAGGAALRAALMTIAFGVLYFALIVVLHGGTQPLQRIARLVRELMSRKGNRTEEAQTNGTLDEVQA